MQSKVFRALPVNCAVLPIVIQGVIAVIKIILYGNRNDNSISLKLCRALSRLGGVLYFHEGHIMEYAVAPPEFIVYETDSISSLQIQNAIIIFKNGQSDDFPNITSSEGITAIVHSENTGALDKLKNLTVPAVTCGMSAKDTITLSSIGEDEAVVSLQREIILLSGRSLEPCEIKVADIHGLSDYPLLCISAVLILSGKAQDGKISLVN